MGNITFLILIINSLAFSFIFWFLTFCCKYFYQDKYTNYKLNFYECGFKSVTSVRLNISVQYFLLGIFLIIYDSEFVLLFPASFYVTTISSLSFFILYIFIFFIYTALFIDYIFSSLDWNI